MKKISIFLNLILVFISPAVVRGERLPDVNVVDSVVKIWVFFNDKPQQSSLPPVSGRGLARRIGVGFTGGDHRDSPVFSGYLKAVEATGAKLHVVYKWENCASFYVHSSRIHEIVKLPFVREIRPVAEYRNSTFVNSRILSKQLSANTLYGSAANQLAITSVIEAHDYLKRFRNISVPGKGILMAFFDGGARLDHKCFSYILKNHAVKATWDFVQNDSIIRDDDSIAANPQSVHYMDDEHGSQTLGLVAGYDPGAYVGCAWGVELVLAKTENGVVDGESHSEEDNWAAAVVWAESLGVDIISSSLGYRVDFDDSVLIMKNGHDTIIRDYEYADLDGNTTIISRAASYAIQRGMVVVNAIGNEGATIEGTLSAPADVEKVISVGGVDIRGKLCSFSSTGPASDGRIKPDLVALGSAVALPEIYSNTHDTYTTSQGTSFSTPVIAGICALILQSQGKNRGVDGIRELLFKYCHFSPFQQTRDNFYGRGLPDALLSCMRNNDVYLTVMDSLKNPVMSAEIQSPGDGLLSITDRDGKALLRVAPDKLPMVASINLGSQKDTFLINSTPSHRDVFVSSAFHLIINLKSNYGIVDSGVVFYKIEGSSEFSRISAEKGVTILTGTKPQRVSVYAIAPGYEKTDTIQAALCSPSCTLQVKMDDIPAEKFSLFPTVVSKSSGKTLNFELFSPAAEQIKVSIRSVDGRLLWKDRFVAEQTVNRRLSFNSQLRSISPGVYFFILERGGKAVKKKFMVIQ